MKFIVHLFLKQHEAARNIFNAEQTKRTSTVQPVAAFSQGTILYSQLEYFRQAYTDRKLTISMPASLEHLARKIVERRQILQSGANSNATKINVIRRNYRDHAG